MEPTVDVINRSLAGDSEARDFLETTFSSYALDVSDSSNPKTFGGWNFINQAMNEIERYEGRYGMRQGLNMVGHARLLASMALGLARRSPKSDQDLIDKCVKEASGRPILQDQVKWLKDVNFELREIVMGRIAATAFDFSFHRRSASTVKSAFADRVVVDTLCATLSANAVSNGPSAIGHFSTEWIIPSAKSLPPFAISSVVLHLADEGSKMNAVAGTKDMLQQLSVLVMSVSLGPILAESVTGNISNAGAASYDDIAHVAAMCLRAMDAWCTATDLSLPQIKHVCQKVQIDLISVLSDAMYSDSHNVVDALAQLVESHGRLPDDKFVFIGRMKQLRRILELDEETFTSRFDQEQLKVIETKEMGHIIEELVLAIGLQRFRFTERQNSGHHDVCRNLARIATSIADTWLDTISGAERRLDNGIVSLLLKAAAHPSVNICGIALEALFRLVSVLPEITTDVLRTLQRRAIISYHQKPDGSISFSASDICGVHFEEFQTFRETSLSETLIACWRVNGEGYMTSCTTAVEEFCAAQARVDVCLGLEAAIYCIEAVAAISLESNTPYTYTNHLKRCFNALSLKPASLTGNPLTLARACSLAKMYAGWFKEVNTLPGAVDLVLSIFSLAAASGVASPKSSEETGDEIVVSPVKEACFALKELLCRYPTNMDSSDIALPSLLHGWAVTYTIIRHGGPMSFDARKALATGVSNYIAKFSEEAKSVHSLQTILRPTIENLEVLAREAAAEASKEGIMVDKQVPRKLGEEIMILSCILREYTAASSKSRRDRESGCSTSSKVRPDVGDFLRPIVQQLWGSIEMIATTSCRFEEVASPVAYFLSQLLPTTVNDVSSRTTLDNVFSLAEKMIGEPVGNAVSASSICAFLKEAMQLYSSDLEEPKTNFGMEHPAAPRTHELITKVIECHQSQLGDSWLKVKRQDQGQAAMERQSPSPPRLSPESVSNVQLEAVLSFLGKALDYCPTFVMKLPSDGTSSGNEDLLVARGMEAAVCALSDLDSTLVSSAILFILSLSRSMTDCNDDANQKLCSDIISGHRSTIIHLLLKGCCGEFETGMLDAVADLLGILVTMGDLKETEGFVVASLQQEYFFMGNRSKSLTLKVMGECASKNCSTKRLRTFLEHIWRIHKAKNQEELPDSDVVVQFLQQFQSQ